MKHLLVFGSPRSGTTWLASLLAAAPFNRLVFEPEIYWADELCDIYIDNDPLPPNIEKQATAILENRIPHLGPYRHGRRTLGYHK